MFAHELGHAVHFALGVAEDDYLLIAVAAVPDLIQQPTKLVLLLVVFADVNDLSDVVISAQLCGANVDVDKPKVD